MHALSPVLASLLALSNVAMSQSLSEAPAVPVVVAPAPAVSYVPHVPPAPHVPVVLAQNDKDKDAARAEREAARAQAEADRGEAEARRRDSRRAPTEEEALALAAMEGLMSQPPQRALPLIKKVLTGSQTTLVKQRALFVLSQIDEPEAQAMLLETAKSAGNPLRREAIRNIGIGGNAKSMAGLQEVYAGGDSSVKKYVLEAWLIAGRKTEVYQAALNAKTDADAASAIRTLSAMGAVDELRKLGDQQKHGRSLLEAYAIAGDLASLRKIADGPGEISVRAEAVRRIGIVGTEAARTALKEIYTANAHPQLRDAALNGMLVSGDQQGVLALYRAAKTTEEKRTLLRTLSIMGGDAALQAIDAALEGKK